MLPPDDLRGMGMWTNAAARPLAYGESDFWNGELTRHDAVFGEYVGAADGGREARGVQVTDDGLVIFENGDRFASDRDSGCGRGASSDTTYTSEQVTGRVDLNGDGLRNVVRGNSHGQRTVDFGTGGGRASHPDCARYAPTHVIDSAGGFALS